MEMLVLTSQIESVGVTNRVRKSQLLVGDQWWPFFYKILFSCNRHIVFSDSTFLFNKLGVNVGILLLYIFFLNRL